MSHTQRSEFSTAVIAENIKVNKSAKIRNRYNQVPHLTQDIVRPANRDWACQTERCHTLSNKTSHSKSGVIAYARFTRATN